MQEPHGARRWITVLVMSFAVLVLSSCGSQSSSGSRPETESTAITAAEPVAPTTVSSGAEQATSTTTPIDPAEPERRIWRPGPEITWQWQLTGTIDSSVDAEMFNIDLFETPSAVVDELHSLGRVVVCYISAGTYEDFRPDVDAFPQEVIGRPNGWDGERWLDIRRLDVLAPIMEARLDLCRSKGFDGVEMDNVDGYVADTGFSLTAKDQLTYNRFLASAAHARGLSIGLKNDVRQAIILEPFFDWAINEECVDQDECEPLTAFIDAGKAVFHVEYDLDIELFCPEVTALGFSSMRKRLDLDAWRSVCP